MSGVSLYLANRMVTQAEFADLVGISEARTSQLASEGVLGTGQSALTWLRAYVDRLREQASGRDADGTLVKERAGLAREQRIGQALKNAVAQGEYAPIGLLSDVLGLASAAVAERMDALVPALKAVWPDMPEIARNTIEGKIASARNDWAQATIDLAIERIDRISGIDDEEPADA